MNQDKGPVTRLNSNYMKQYDAQMERHKRRKKRLYRRLTLFAVLIVAVFGYLLNYHLDQRQLYNEKVNQYEQLQQDLDKLKAEEKDLKEEMNLLKDTDYILQIARKDYFLSKEGEIIFNVPEDGDLSY
ncbi:FtsB family cell division protein [Salinibacillus xinjiangensis]|uniref:Septum formation initiator family protein n=1 Tax=Salinibacillus xinjiangensis TaxID=1229268 RepID=A0A6G1XB98_9BACI|nr:septum formation initiator family protein [Salinibacillus xinjiangensis]MRG88185.1 septum formation initiator family protein [Salinibacillus xinjiangensis]